ncbi:uncharacterized protein LOC123532567 isoform X2 [Mercenaria mercenaria]|nr:uncharacterized protein LOC123532567 isoform X2 [Mercenaria mercenaria]
MMVVTRKFNPSVCTFGVHGCEPHYRMEREVVWSNKEAKNKEGRKLREVFQDERTVTTKLECDDNSQDDGNSDDDNNRDNEYGDGWENDASFDENVDDIKSMVIRMIDEVTKQSNRVEASTDTRRDHLLPKGGDTGQEESQLEKPGNSLNSEMIKVGQVKKQSDQSDIGNIRELEKVQKVMSHKEAEYDEEMKRDIISLYDTARYEFKTSSSEKSNYDDKSDVGGRSNGEEMIEKNTENKKMEQNSNYAIIEEIGVDNLPRFDDLAKPGQPDIDMPDLQQSPVNLDGGNEEYGSAFGIMRVYCESELHTAWNGKTEFHGH